MPATQTSRHIIANFIPEVAVGHVLDQPRCDLVLDDLPDRPLVELDAQAGRPAVASRRLRQSDAHVSVDRLVDRLLGLEEVEEREGGRTALREQREQRGVW